MTESATGEFLDVRRLLEQSEPRAPVRWFGYAAGFLLLMVVLGALGSGGGGALVQLVAMVGMAGLIVAMGVVTWSAARIMRAEQEQMQAVEELIQLRRWSEAGLMLDHMLSRPARSAVMRVQMLLCLAAVLGRYHRYGDAIAVYDHLLGLEFEDEQSVHGLRLGRAMSLLHDERLYDADRAINELRRGPGAGESGGLALVEIYRDVKTGHPEDAIATFGEKLAAMRKQLGQRVADAYGLVARAHDLLGQQAEAQQAYESATLLAPEAELSRRYGEVAALAGRYRAAEAPGEET